MLVGVRQSGLVGSLANAEMHQLAQAAGKPIADLAQRIGMAQLAEQHGHELGPAVEALGRALGFMLFDQAGEFQTGKMMQQLIEQTRDLYHHRRPPRRFSANAWQSHSETADAGGQLAFPVASKIHFGHECGLLWPRSLGPRLGRSSAVRFNPALTSLAQMSSAIARGLGPMSAIRLFGVTMLRTGSNLRGIRPHSCRSRKKVRSIERRPARVLGASTWPWFFRWVASSPHQSPPRHWQTTETASAASARVHSAGEAISGCTWPSHRPMLSKKNISSCFDCEANRWPGRTRGGKIWPTRQERRW